LTNAPISLTPFDDFRDLLSNLPTVDEKPMDSGNKQQEPNPLGRLGEIAVWFAGWQGKAKPVISRPMVAIFAGNHGVAQHINPLAIEETKQRVAQFGEGKAAINKICSAQDLGLKIYDLALDYPTEDITKNAAQDMRSCAATMAFGMESIAGGTDLLALGDVGVGNEIVACALVMGLVGGTIDDWLGDQGSEKERELITTALAKHQEHLDDPMEVLRHLGGREFAALVGAILAARMEKIPVILDGFAVCAAAAVLHQINPSALDHCLAAHLTTHPGHRRLLEILGKKPLLDLELKSGEAMGAALAAGIVKAAVSCLN